MIRYAYSPRDADGRTTFLLTSGESSSNVELVRTKLSSAVAALALIAAGLLVASPAQALTGTFPDTPPTPPIALDASTVPRPIAVTGLGTVSGVTVTLDFHKIDGSDCAVPGLGSAYSDEIGFTLTSPIGTVVPLISTYPAAPSYANWGATVSRVQVTLDDSAADLVGVNGIPETGTFRPASPLSAFIGEDPNGTWTLDVTDSVGGDSLCYYGASLSITDARVASATTVAASPNPVSFGSPVDLSALVTSPSMGADLSGTVQFFANGTLLGTANVIAGSGSAVLPAVLLPVGTHSITATFSGNTGTAGSTTLAPVTLTVNPAVAPPAPTPPSRVETAA